MDAAALRQRLDSIADRLEVWRGELAFVRSLAAELEADIEEQQSYQAQLEASWLAIFRSQAQRHRTPASKRTKPARLMPAFTRPRRAGNERK